MTNNKVISEISLVLVLANIFLVLANIIYKKSTDYYYYGYFYDY